MLDPSNYRRSDSRDGVAVALADDHRWVVPSPPSADDASNHPFGPKYGALLDAILEAEDLAEVSRAELALLIYLLEINYHLTPQQLQSILLFPPETSTAHAAQSAFHSIALAHLRAHADELQPAVYRPQRQARSLARMTVHAIRGIRFSRLGALFSVKSGA